MAAAALTLSVESIVRICNEFLRGEARSTSLNDILMHYMNRFPTELGSICSACLSRITFDSVACGASRGRVSVVDIPGCSKSFEIELGEFYDEWTGCRVWPGAVHMSGMLLRGEFDVVGANVIELGSGLGLTGIACITAGARSVAFTEYKPTLLDISFENAKKNTGTCCSGFVLDWSDFRYKTHAGFSNWRSEHPGDFLVVGSELVYDEAHADMVIGVLSQLFEAGARAGLIVIMLKPSREGAMKFLATLSDTKQSVPFTCMIQEVQCEDGNVASCIRLGRIKDIE